MILKRKRTKLVYAANLKSGDIVIDGPVFLYWFGLVPCLKVLSASYENSEMKFVHRGPYGKAKRPFILKLEGIEHPFVLHPDDVVRVLNHTHRSDIAPTHK